MSRTGKTLKQRAYHELKKFLLISLYLWIFFGLFILYKSIILSEEHIDFVAHGVAIINALALGKIMLIAEEINPDKGMNHAPLIYPTLWKSAIYTAILAVFKILEDAAIGHIRGKSFHDSIGELGGSSLHGMIILSGILFVILIPLVAIGEMQRVLGEGRLGEIFFRSRDVSKPFGRQPI
jgi:hypothetical protein